jgi:hypothetical protein
MIQSRPQAGVTTPITSNTICLTALGGLAGIQLGSTVAAISQWVVGKTGTERKPINITFTSNDESGKLLDSNGGDWTPTTVDWVANTDDTVTIKGFKCNPKCDPKRPSKQRWVAKSIDNEGKKPMQVSEIQPIPGSFNDFTTRHQATIRIFSQIIGAGIGAYLAYRLQPVY